VRVGLGLRTGNQGLHGSAGLSGLVGRDRSVYVRGRAGRSLVEAERRVSVAPEQHIGAGPVHSAVEADDQDEQFVRVPADEEQDHGGDEDEQPQQERTPASARPAGAGSPAAVAPYGGGAAHKNSDEDQGVSPAATT
jgi:hypothetical protein